MQNTITGTTTINNGIEMDNKDVSITLKRNAKNNYAWEFTIRGNNEKDISPRITALNNAYLIMYAGQCPQETLKEDKEAL